MQNRKYVIEDIFLLSRNRSKVRPGNIRMVDSFSIPYGRDAIGAPKLVIGCEDFVTLSSIPDGDAPLICRRSSTRSFSLTGALSGNIVDIQIKIKKRFDHSPRRIQHLCCIASISLSSICRSTPNKSQSVTRCQHISATTTTWIHGPPILKAMR